jgi:SAM-dependent methyltransferase
VSTPDVFWEAAGRIGYDEAQFRSPRVARHVLTKQWRESLAVARAIGISDAADVLELGCGDGTFAIEVLGRRYRRVSAMDKSTAAIDRARARSPFAHVEFRIADVTAHRYEPGEAWDGAFLIGFLHHVKGHAATIVERLAEVAPRIVVMEPNGNQPLRKLFEYLPSYRRAGEESFTFRQLTVLFARAGYLLETARTINVFPPFTPDALYPVGRRVEGWFEGRRAVGELCTSRVLGFVRRS